MSFARPDYYMKVRGRKRLGVYRKRPAPLLDQTKLDQLQLDDLRLAIRANSVTFPSQVPVFGKHDRPDMQWRIAQLYFVFGWSCATIAAKYGFIRQRIAQILKTWTRRAVEMGYIQVIPPVEVLSALVAPAQALPPLAATARALPFRLPIPAPPPEIRAGAHSKSAHQ
jgi:hypothetical protein